MSTVPVDGFVPWLWLRRTWLKSGRARPFSQCPEFVFMLDDLRNGGDENKPHGVNEVRLRQGRIVREGLRTTLGELRLHKDWPSARKRRAAMCGTPALFIVGRERAKLGYFWRHAYRVPRSGPYLGCVVNSETGKPVEWGESRLTVAGSENGSAGSRLEMVIGISTLIRVPRRTVL
jgi:hypothetical protein